jgi:outer membrane protein assembly factor BamB
MLTRAICIGILALVICAMSPSLLSAAADRKQPDDLPAVRDLPELLVGTDGAKVASKDQWPKRREELLQLVLTYEYGHLPPATPMSASNQSWKPEKSAERGEAKRAEDPVPLPAGATETQFVLTTGPDGKVKIPFIVTRPAGIGPFPTIVRGDLCWGRVTTDIAAEVVRRGYMLVEFDRTAIVPDEDVPKRDVGLYALYPDLDFGALAAWAWGYHRIIDYLLTRDDVQKNHIAVTGHSRGGKTTLLAGATDERVALTAPNNSGCGGAGGFRFQGDKCETIDVITKRFGYWFQPQFNEFVGKAQHLPIDQHSVKALCAPRALLETEALGDLWANPEGSQHTYLATRKVYELLGIPDKIGIVFREGGHQHGLPDWQVLLDFADKTFFGKPIERKFDALAFPENRLKPDPNRYTWMQFRGPTGDGVSDARDVPTKWSEDDGIAWKTPIPGKAWSSPVVLGKQIWLTNATPDARQLSAVCVDRETGKIVHDPKLFDVEKPEYIHPFNSAGSPTPALEPGRVYVTFGYAGTACLDTETGKTIWERTDAELVINHYRGPGSSPLLYKDMLVMNFDGSDHQFIIALDKRTGKTLWKTDRSIDYQDADQSGKILRDGDMRKGFSTPRISTLGGVPLILSLGSKCFYAYRPSDGKEVWRLENRKSHSGSSTPLVGDQFIYFCSGLGHETLSALKPGGQGVLSDAQIAWKVEKGVPGKPSPLLVDGRIYMCNDGGIASCVDAKTGAEIWHERLPGNYSASPVYADGKLYFCNEDGLTTVLEAGPKFQKLAENELDDGIMASPAVADHSIIVRTKSNLYRIGPKSEARK